MLLHTAASLVIYRNTIPFAYLVQAEGGFSAAHLLHSHSVSLHVQWKYRVASNDSFFLPNRCPAALESVQAELPESSLRGV
jgi:hypothetical protein